MRKQEQVTDSPPIQRQSIADQVYRRIKRDILTGQIALGTRVVETQISRDYGTSRAPVREALQRLIQEGLLEDRPHHAPSVISLDRDSIIQLYEARLAIESRAVEKICSRTDNPDLDLLDALIEAMRAASRDKDLQRLVDSELAFHTMLCRLSGNDYLLRISQSLQDHVQLALWVDNANYTQMQDVAEEHVRLVDAIRARDSNAAVEELKTHIMASLEKL